MVRRYLIWAFVIFVAGMMTGFIPKLIHQVRLENALEEFKQAFLERADLNISHIKEIAELLIKTRRGTTAVEDARISKRLSQIQKENEAVDERLARARKKFCDLAGEEELLCWEKKKEWI